MSLCTSSSDCGERFYCDTVLRICISCRQICDVRKHLESVCNSQCPGFLQDIAGQADSSTVDVLPAEHLVSPGHVTTSGVTGVTSKSEVLVAAIVLVVAVNVLLIGCAASRLVVICRPQSKPAKYITEVTNKVKLCVGICKCRHSNGNTTNQLHEDSPEFEELYRRSSQNVDTGPCLEDGEDDQSTGCMSMDNDHGANSPSTSTIEPEVTNLSDGNVRKAQVETVTSLTRNDPHNSRSDNISSSKPTNNQQDEFSESASHNKGSHGQTNSISQESEKRPCLGGSKVDQPKRHPNKMIYDTLKCIDWVPGYYSEGTSIDVFVNTDQVPLEVALKELTVRTGCAPDKFHVKHESENV